MAPHAAARLRAAVDRRDRRLPLFRRLRRSGHLARTDREADRNSSDVSRPPRRNGFVRDDESEFRAQRRRRGVSRSDRDRRQRPARRRVRRAVRTRSLCAPRVGALTRGAGCPVRASDPARPMAVGRGSTRGRASTRSGDDSEASAGATAHERRHGRRRPPSDGRGPRIPRRPPRADRFLRSRCGRARATRRSERPERTAPSPRGPRRSTDGAAAERSRRGRPAREHRT